MHFSHKRNVFVAKSVFSHAILAVQNISFILNVYEMVGG